MEDIFDFVNGDMIMRSEVKKELIDIMRTDFKPGEGNGHYRAIKKLRELSIGMSLKQASSIITSIELVKEGEESL